MPIVHSQTGSVHLASASDLAEHAALSLWPPDAYDDEPPVLNDSDYYEPSQEDLDWLLSQRDDCLALPETLAELDRQIGSVRRHLIISEVAEFLAATRIGGGSW